MIHITTSKKTGPHRILASAPKASGIPQLTGIPPFDMSANARTYHCNQCNNKRLQLSFGNMIISSLKALISAAYGYRDMVVEMLVNNRTNIYAEDKGFTTAGMWAKKVKHFINIPILGGWQIWKILF